MLLGKKLGSGRTAEVYELRDEDNKVIKLFHDTIPFEYIEKEYEISKLINSLGIPSPNAEELLKLENKWGSIISYEEYR